MWSAWIIKGILSVYFTTTAHRWVDAPLSSFFDYQLKHKKCSSPSSNLHVIKHCECRGVFLHFCYRSKSLKDDLAWICLRIVFIRCQKLNAGNTSKAFQKCMTATENTLLWATRSRHFASPPTSLDKCNKSTENFVKIFISSPLKTAMSTLIISIEGAPCWPYESPLHLGLKLGRDFYFIYFLFEKNKYP